jgi:hypothetical protein
MTWSKKECIDGSAYTLRQIQKYLLGTFFLLVDQKIAIDGKAGKIFLRLVYHQYTKTSSNAV